MLRTYPLDPHRRMRPSGILDLVRVHAQDLATPAIDRPTP